MTCARCQGLMVTDSFIDLHETGHLWMKAWRCMNCGYVVDTVMAQNRLMQAAGRIGSIKTPSHQEPTITSANITSQQAA